MSVRIPVNLASEPFGRDRPFIVTSTALAVLLAGLLGVLVFLGVRERGQAADTRRDINRLSAQLRTVQTEQARIEGNMRRSENAEVLDRSVFLNTLIEHRAISWTRIFSDLQRVMPHNVRLISVRLPQINSQGAVLLVMDVGALSLEPVLELLKRLEASPLFGAYSISNTLPPSQIEPAYRVRMSVIYGQKL